MKLNLQKARVSVIRGDGLRTVHCHVISAAAYRQALLMENDVQNEQVISSKRCNFQMMGAALWGSMTSAFSQR